MEKHNELREKALEYLKHAEHGIKFTYPLVKDNKVLLSVVNNLFLACTNIMGSLLHFELQNKSIQMFEDNFESKYQLMRSHILEKYHIDPNYMRLMRDLKDIVVAHSKSPIEFSRGSRYIICGDNYELQEISPDSLKDALQKTKVFIDEVTHLIV